jgi:hypothetical protein
MNLQELKTFLESPEGKTDEVTSYLRGLFPVSLQTVQQFAETAEGRAWLDSQKDKHLQKGLETCKSNNLEAMIDTEIKKRFPEKDARDLELDKLKTEIETMKDEKQRESLLNKAMKLAGEKGLPLELVSFFVGADDKTTDANLQKFEESYNAAVQKSLEERLKTDSYTPPAHTGGGTSLEDLSMDEYIKARQKG